VSLWGTFERALIWNGVREGFYEATRQQRQPFIGPARGGAEDATVQSVDVTYECPNGHQYEVTLPGEKVERRRVPRGQCHECNNHAYWRYLDLRLENFG
jgi:hypothetical protein